MKKLLFISTILLLLISCREVKTTEMQLRQMNQKENVSENSNGSFFLFFGNYDKQQNTYTTVRVCALADSSYYTFIDIPIEKLLIKLSKDTIPTLKIKVVSDYKIDSDIENINIAKNCSNCAEYIITCNEKYLPKNLNKIIYK